MQGLVFRRTKKYTELVLGLKKLFDLEANIFPWTYALLVAVLMAFYLGASSYFEEDVNGMQVRTSRSRLSVNNPDLRSLQLSEDRIKFSFNWRHHLIVYGKNGVKRRMLPTDYTVDAGEVFVNFNEDVNIVFRDMDDIFVIQTTLPTGYSASLSWEINDKYELVQDNPYFSYLREPGQKDPLFEVFSASGQTEFTSEKILFKGQDTLTLRPYGGGRATLEEWLAKEQNMSVKDDRYRLLQEMYYNGLFTQITDKLNAQEEISVEEETAALALALLSGDTALYQQFAQRFASAGIADFNLAGFAGNMADALPSYLRYVQDLRTRISQATIAKNRSIYAQPDLAAFLVNHRLTQAHEIFVAMTAERMSSVSVYDLVNQLIFLLDSQYIRRTSAKENLIVQHLNQIIPYLVSLYQGLYLSNRDMETGVFSTLPAIKLGSALLRLADAGFTEGNYGAHYRRIGLKLMETALTSFATLGRIPAEITFKESLSYSEDSLDLQSLRFIMKPRYEIREHGRLGDLSSARYVLSAADHVEIATSTSSKLEIKMKWPARIHQYFAVFGIGAVNKVSVNQNELTQSQNSQLGMNEWYFLKDSNVLLVNLYHDNSDLNIVLDLSSPQLVDPPPAVVPTVKSQAVAVETEAEDSEKELSPKEKKKLEDQRRKEEKRLEEQRKKEQKKKQEEEQK